MDMARVIDVAQYIFTEYYKMSDSVIDEMKLHKLLYLAQRESLAITNEPLFNAQFEGWKYGPVCRDVRNAYTGEGMYDDNIKELNPEEKYIVKNVIIQYGAFESWKLSELSHKETSWRKSRIGIPNGQNGKRIIKLEDIREDAKKIRPYDPIWDMYYDEFDDLEEM